MPYTQDNRSIAIATPLGKDKLLLNYLTGRDGGRDIDLRKFALEGMSLYEYTARVLARLCETALEQVSAGGGRLVNYLQLPTAIWPELLKYWKVDFSDADVARMLEVAQMDAKNPVLPFEPDSRTKRESISAELRGLTRQWLDGVYEQLEAQRQVTGFA